MVETDVLLSNCQQYIRQWTDPSHTSIVLVWLLFTNGVGRSIKAQNFLRPPVTFSAQSLQTKFSVSAPNTKSMSKSLRPLQFLRFSGTVASEVIFFADEGTGCCGSLDGPATSSDASSGLLRSCAFWKQKYSCQNLRQITSQYRTCYIEVTYLPSPFQTSRKIWSLTFLPPFSGWPHIYINWLNKSKLTISPIKWCVDNRWRTKQISDDGGAFSKL